MEHPASRTLHPPTSLSPQTIYFLNSNLSTIDELHGAANLLSELKIQHDTIDQSLLQLDENLRSQLTRYCSHSDRIGSLSNSIRSQLHDLLQSSSSQSPSGTSNEVQSRRGMGEELQALAKEVARVETVRNYAETALKLDRLVGDIEDAVSYSRGEMLKRHPLKMISQDIRVVALRDFRSAEDVLSSIKKKHPQWERLVSSVDHRIDRALAIIRPQAIADHRALLSSLGWPPPLSALSSSTPDTKGQADLLNPLFTMHGDLKLQYRESFLALCGLQELQRRRKSRQLEGHYKHVSLHQPLWVIEELVNPISIASQRHFSKWIEKPEYIFALVYKITRDYIDSMDDLLQPFVDEAMLSGYSCREEWISAMVSSLSTYLAKEIFPTYVSQLNEENSDTGNQTQARVSWLHLVDVMISFDKKVQSLAAHSEMLLSLQEDDNMQKMSSLAVFCDRPVWLDLWAEIELTDTLYRLKPQLEDARNWIIECQENNKSPLICSVVIRHLSAVIDRCRSLPSISSRGSFIKLTGGPIIHKFIECLQQRCQEAEGLTALTDNAGLTKVTKSINAACYFESVLQEWSEDVSFMELGFNQPCEPESSIMSSYALENSIFYQEIQSLKNFRSEWIEKLSTVVLRGFDAHCRDYIKNKKQWQEKNEEGLTLSRSFIEAVDYLQGRTSLLEEGLNKMDFTKFWRTLAAGIDRFIFDSILIANVKFHDGGVERLWNDISILFGIFGSWCLRPEGFFPKVNEGSKLLKMANKQLKTSLIVEDRWLKENNIRHLTVAEVERIVKNRVVTR